MDVFQYVVRIQCPGFRIFPNILCSTILKNSVYEDMTRGVDQFVLGNHLVWMRITFRIPALACYNVSRRRGSTRPLTVGHSPVQCSHLWNLKKKNKYDIKVHLCLDSFFWPSVYVTDWKYIYSREWGTLQNYPFQSYRLWLCKLLLC